MLQRDGIRVADRASELKGGKLLEAQQAVDVEVPLIVECAEVLKGGSVNPGDAASRAQRLGHAGGNDVDLVVAGHRQTHIGRANVGLNG